MTKDEQFREMAETLLDLIATVEATGGVETNAAGEPEPAGDPEWIDLGAAYVRAKAVIEDVCQGSYRNLPTPVDTRDTRIRELELELVKLRFLFREPMARLFGLSVRDLETRSAKRDLFGQSGNENGPR